MSNSNWESLRGYEEQVIVGAEAVNGTGQVSFRLYQASESAYGDGSEAVFLNMTAEDALEFAKLISRQAHEAMRARWNENNILTG